MNSRRPWLPLAALLCLAAAAATSACAGQHQPPKALTDAREELVRTKNGEASRLNPAGVHQADMALERAEAAFRDSPDDPSTTDLAIVADRTALIAQTDAATMRATQETEQARAALGQAQANELQSAQGQLGQTRSALGQTQMQLQQEQAVSAAQAQKLQDMSAKLKDARDTISKIAAVKDDDRGMVITLQGEVLFKTAKWDLKPGAMAKLDEIARALKGKEQPIVVAGYTDNVGGTDMNLDLSQKRAGAVRDYLASKGIPQDLITAQGKGPSDPISDNTTTEGRASNRRVEIVVQPKK